MAAAKNSLGLYSIWIDDEQYEAIINAVLEKVVDIEHNVSGDWIQTFSGKRFKPLRPDPDLICIEDIAHALSLICRYAGHCISLESVAEHCVLISDAIIAAGGSEHDALMGLMHDSPEAYVIDLARPIKKSVIGYDRVEARVWEAVCCRFGLSVELPPIVKQFDQRIVADERAQNMAILAWDHETGPALGVKVQCWAPARAEQEFLNRFRALYPLAAA